MVEIWKDVVGYEGLYHVSNLGNVKSLPKEWQAGVAKRRHAGFMMSQRATYSGYMRVGLSKNSNRTHIFTHRLVAQAFVPNANLLLEINHKDGNKQNNCAENLEWCTRSQNMIHAFKQNLATPTFGNRKLSRGQILSIKSELNLKKKSQKEISIAYGVTQSTISLIKLKKLWNEIR